MAKALTNTIVELHVPDFEKVKMFYKKLGFKVAWERKPEGFSGYLVMKLGGNILCFWPGNRYVYRHPYFSKFSRNTKRGYGVEIVLFVDNVQKIYLLAKKYAKVVEPLKLKPWGFRDFRIEDPYGYYIRISEPYDTLNGEEAAVP